MKYPNEYNFSTRRPRQLVHPPTIHHGSRLVVDGDSKPSYRDVVTGNLRRMDDYKPVYAVDSQGRRHEVLFVSTISGNVGVARFESVPLSATRTSCTLSGSVGAHGNIGGSRSSIRWCCPFQVGTDQHETREGQGP
jgi:hypothetical protein